MKKSDEDPNELVPLPEDQYIVEKIISHRPTAAKTEKEAKDYRHFINQNHRDIFYQYGYLNLIVF